MFPVCFGLCYMYVQVYKCISVIQVRYNHCEKLRRMDRNNPSHSHRTFGLPPSARGCSVGGQFKSYYLGHPSPSSSPTTMSSQHHSSSPNLVGGHYRVGRKIGEGSFGVIFEGLLFFPFSSPSPAFPPTWTLFFATGTNLLNSQTVAIKFVSPHSPRCSLVVPFTVLTQSPTQEPRKAEAPQLRDECRSYRILAGCRQYNALSRRMLYSVTIYLFSWYPSNLPLWARGIAQHPRH